MTEKQDNMESFAKRIETRVKAGGNGTDSMERLVCRLMAGNKVNPKIAAFLAVKWVEWRYGKATQPITGQNGGPVHILVEHINGTENQAAAKAE